MSLVKVDVFIPVYNDLRFLPHAVSSALNQVGVDVRVVVSDNASTDGTYEWISEQASKDQRIRLFRNATNVGHIANINKYRELVEAPYYMFLCSDDMLLAPDALQKASEIMERDPRAVSIFADMMYIDKVNTGLMARRFHRSGLFSGDSVLRQSLIKLRNMFGIPLLNRTQIHKQIAYPSNYPYSADVFIAASAARMGNVYHIPEILIGNRYSGGNLTNALFWHTLKEFRKMEVDFSLKLGPIEHFSQRINSPIVALSKFLFLSWIKLRG